MIFIIIFAALVSFCLIGFATLAVFMGAFTMDNTKVHLQVAATFLSGLIGLILCISAFVWMVK